jgi:hypothetical protein
LQDFLQAPLVVIYWHDGYSAMSSKGVIRFAFSVADKPRLLFSLRQNASGIVTLALPRAEYYVPPAIEGKIPIGGNVKKPGISQHKYSIHPSRESIENINVLHHTLVIGREVFETRQHTKAIKEGKTFALIYCRRCPKLLIPAYNIDKTSGTIVNLASFDEINFTLFYGVYVTATDNEFVLNDPETSVHQEIHFGIRFIIVWTFLSVPAANYAGSLHGVTKPPTDPEQENRVEGYSNAESIGMFKTCVVELTHDLFARLEKEQELPVPVIRAMSGNAKYFRTGSRNTPEWKMYERFLTTRFALSQRGGIV